MADLNLYLILGIAFPLVLAVIPFMAKSKVLALFPFFGAIIAAYVFLGVAADGCISIGSGGCGAALPSGPIVSASLNSGTWQAALLVPLSMVIIDFLLCGYTAVKR